MRVLIIKTTSLGDIIHTLPALTDAQNALPEATFDWVVEQPFAEVPAWHKAVDRIIPIGLRRWRREGWKALKKRELLDFLTALRQEKYDFIIDAQGLLKSAALTVLARGKRVGLSWDSARESLASLFYQKKAVVPWEQHAVIRARALFAEGLGYPLPQSPADYGINLKTLSIPSMATPYYVFLHGTTWDTKHWPEAYWIELAKRVEMTGHSIQLLWGNDVEQVRANKIAASVKCAVVAPHKLKLSEVAGVLAGAAGIVSVDTGLGHLAAALGVPTVSLYGPSDPKLSGTHGARQLHLAATFPCSPCFSRTCTVKGDKPIDPPCFQSLSPDKVWESLKVQVGIGVA